MPMSLLKLGKVVNLELFLLSLLVRASASQEVAVLECAGCTLNPATTTIAAVSNAVSGTIGPAPPGSYVVFTAYSVTSAYLSEEACITDSGLPISMKTYLSVTRPSTAAATAFQSSALATFADYLGISSCGNGKDPVVNFPDETPTALVLLSSNKSASATPFGSSTFAELTSAVTPAPTSTPLLSTTSANPRETSTRLSEGDRIAIGVVVIVIISALLLGIVYLQRRRKRRESGKDGNNPPDFAEDTQPYLQQKAELDSDERKQQLELDAQELRYEMDGANTRHEVEGANNSNEVSAEGTRRKPLSLGLTHELRGEEHSKELAGPEIL